MIGQAALLCQIGMTLTETQQLRQRPKMQRQVLPVAQPGGMQVTLVALVSQRLQRPR